MSGVFILFDNHTHTYDATFLLYLLHVCSGIIDYDIWSGIINFEITYIPQKCFCATVEIDPVPVQITQQQHNTLLFLVSI